MSEDAMTDTMPTRESLDEAALAAEYSSWPNAFGNLWPNSAGYRSIIAHARTLDKLHGRTPVDPDVEAVKRIIAKWDSEALYYWDTFPDDLAAAVAQFKQEKAR